MSIKNLYDKIKGKGMVKNFSSFELWIVETDTGPPIAHKLEPKHKTPSSLDADGFKRVDGKNIKGHDSWWKIFGHQVARIRNENGKVTFDGLFLKSPENQFNAGENKEIKPEKRSDPGWGEVMKYITNVKRDKKGVVLEYFIDEGVGWIPREKAIQMAFKGEIDNVVVVIPTHGPRTPYLRSWPDNKKANNFSNMGK